MSRESARKQLVRSAWRAGWDLGDTEAFDSVLAPDYVRVSTADGRRQSRDDFKTAVRSTREAFPDLKTTIDEIVEEGDRMAIRWHSTATHTGTFLGLPPTERAVEVSGVTFAQFADEQIVEETVTWDPRHLVPALGVVPLR
jgi:steroid delta-isomerase-like uncharacterized protein